MRDFQFKVPSKDILELRDQLGVASSSEVLAEALNLLHWAVGESEKGRFILSSTPDGEDFQKVSTWTLDRIQQRVASTKQKSLAKAN